MKTKSYIGKWPYKDMGTVIGACKSIMEEEGSDNLIVHWDEGSGPVVRVYVEIEMEALVSYEHILRSYYAYINGWVAARHKTQEEWDNYLKLCDENGFHQDYECWRCDELVKDSKPFSWYIEDAGVNGTHWFHICTTEKVVKEANNE